jgi:Skp family chaperone for outer membrane proteins
MTIPSRRAILTVGLGVLGLVGRAFGAPVADEDKPKEKEKDKDQDKEGAPKPDAAGPGPGWLIGTVDMNSVMKGYVKVKEGNDRFKDDIQAKNAELQKMVARAKRESDDLATLQPGTRDHAELEAKVKKLKEQVDAMRRQANTEYGKRQAEMLAGFQHEIQEAIAIVARRRGLSLVLRAPKGAEEGANLGAVVSTIAREVLYVDARADLTEEVITLLNTKA